MNEQKKLTIINKSSDGENTDEFEISTTCFCYGTEDNYTIEYDEFFAEDMKSHTTIRVKNKTCAHILRQGSINTELIVEKGVRHNCAYGTPYGELMVGITAIDIESVFKTNYVRLNLNYATDFNGEINQTKQMKIIIR